MTKGAQKKFANVLSAEDVSAKYHKIVNLKGYRQTNFLLISNQLSQFACCACRHPHLPLLLPPPKVSNVTAIFAIRGGHQELKPRL